MQSLILGGLLAAYGVQAYSELPACESEATEADVTYTMKRTFQTCFIIHLAQFLQSTFLSRLFTIMPFANGQQRIEHKLATKLAIVDTVTEQVLRVALGMMVLWQTSIVFKSDFDPCFEKHPVLQASEHIMVLLLLMQAAFIAVFTLWSFYLMTFEQILEKLRNEKAQEGLSNFYATPRNQQENTYRYLALQSQNSNNQKNVERAIQRTNIRQHSEEKRRTRL